MLRFGFALAVSGWCVLIVGLVAGGMAVSAGEPYSPTTAEAVRYGLLFTVWGLAVMLVGVMVDAEDN
jgi:hypothetical protein